MNPMPKEEMRLQASWSASSKIRAEIASWTCVETGVLRCCSSLCGRRLGSRIGGDEGGLEIFRPATVGGTGTKACFMQIRISGGAAFAMRFNRVNNGTMAPSSSDSA